MGNDGAVRWSRRRRASEERSGKGGRRPARESEGRRDTAAEECPPAMLRWSAPRRPEYDGEVGGGGRPGTDIGWGGEASWGRAHNWALSCVCGERGPSDSKNGRL